MECELCNKICKNTKGLSEHLKIHDITLFDYLNRNREIPKCPICNNSCKPYKRKYTATCCSQDCIRVNSTNRVHSKDTIEKIRQKRVEYLQKKTGKTAWERRSRKEMSYLESWFQEEIIIKHKLNEKHQIITEYHVGGYFIDFAFLDKMIAVEIDGRCHFDKNMIRHDRDFKKDEVLKAEGWNVIRMNFHDIRHNNAALVENFLNLLDLNKGNFCDWFGHMRYTEYKKSNKKIIPTAKLPINYEINLKRKANVLSSDIDFTKHGWVQQTSILIGITPQKTRKWFEKNMPDILEQAFKRK